MNNDMGHSADLPRITRRLLQTGSIAEVNTNIWLNSVDKARAAPRRGGGEGGPIDGRRPQM
jgi:hypothetical protein